MPIRLSPLPARVASCSASSRFSQVMTIVSALDDEDGAHRMAGSREAGGRSFRALWRRS